MSVVNELKSFENYDFTFGFQSVNQVIGKKSTEYVKLLSRRESEIYNSLKIEKRKSEWLAGRIASKTAYIEFCRKFDLPLLNNVTVLNNRNRAPYLLEFPDLQLSITHSNEFAVAALSYSKIGIDLESIVSGNPLLLKYFFTNKESDVIFNESASTGDINAFIAKYWTRKEAVAKYLRLGMKMNFKLLDTTDDFIYNEKSNSCPIKLKSYKLGDYYLSVAV